MEGYHVAFIENELVDWIKNDITVPPSRCYWLAWIGWAGPRKHLHAEGQAGYKLSWVADFVVQVPHYHCVWVFEGADNVDHVALEHAFIDIDFARTLHPLRIVLSWNWLGLVSIFPSVAPAVIKEDWNDLCLPALGDCEEGKNIFDVLSAVFDIGGYMEEDPEFAKAEVWGPP